MKLQSPGKEIVRQPGILVWHGTPSDHSGAYHIILSVGINGIPVEVGIENPDCCRLEIPGLIDSGWDPKPEKVVAEFFESAKTCRPKKGVYFNEQSVNTIADLESLLQSFSHELEQFFKDPSNIPSNMDSCEDGSLLIYNRLDNHIESNFYTELFDPEEDDMKKLSTQLSRIRQFMTSDSDSDGFIQFITSEEDWLRVDGLTDFFCWWLWDTPQRLVRRINDG